MTDKRFQIYRLATLLETPGALTSFEREQEFAWQLILFLRINNLVSDDSLPRRKENVNKDFKLVSTQLTEEGLSVLREGLYKWLERNDDINRTSIDMRPLEKALDKVRGDQR